MMIQQQAVFGGEGNGGPIDPRVGYVRDSFVGMALTLDAMAERADRGPTGGRIAALRDPQDESLAAKRPGRRSARSLGRRIFADAQADRLDGLRLDWPDRWLLVRASNTEPIVRLVAEAKTMEDARSLCPSRGRADAQDASARRRHRVGTRGLAIFAAD